MGNEILVTVTVITYNSERFVIETLDSIFNQTYKNIELVVSDDASKDNTVKVCKDWIEAHKGRFVRCKLLTVEKNTGTASNVNRALAEARGEWIKSIAGDDLLFPNAIEEYLSFVQEGNDISAVTAKNVHFFGDIADKNFYYQDMPYAHVAFGKRVTAKKQYSILKKMFIGLGPTCFFKKSVLDQVGGYNEKYPSQEDYVLHMDIAKAGYKLHYLPKFLVYYRVDENSVSHAKDSKNAILGKNRIKCIQVYKYAYQYENLNAIWKLFLKFDMYLNNRIIKAGNNRTSLRCRILAFEARLMSPFDWYKRIMRWMEKLLSIFDR